MAFSVKERQRKRRGRLKDQGISEIQVCIPDHQVLEFKELAMKMLNEYKYKLKKAENKS